MKVDDKSVFSMTLKILTLWKEQLESSNYMDSEEFTTFVFNRIVLEENNELAKVKEAI